MEKRKIENLGIETSLLGFGCMRFPLQENGKIVELLAEKMLDEAIANGVNYIDTAYLYHDGASEPFVGRALKKYDRKSFYLATKLPMWPVNTIEDAKRIFAEQLERLQTDYIDFYLLHALNQESFEKAAALGIIELCETWKKEGKIKYFGFSFHDSYEVFEQILTCHNWDFCQIQYNYMDTEKNPGDRGYELTEKLDIPVIVMEPVRGGALTRFSEDINLRFRELDETASLASYALRWAGSHPNVKVILSGMSTPEQVADNLRTFTPFYPLKQKESDRITEIVNTLKKRTQNACTACRYCMPCPAGVNIPFNFSIWNTYHMYRNYEAVAWDWENNLTEQAKAKNCVECGKCEEICPQKINIREDLKKLQRELDSDIWGK